ncbi:MAG TPA: hypothetical protein VGQ16_16810 [Vicinamibacterales bacterium]|jgi:hypothetical protein|nr:hypothetical protein [Vicinamibacterales bacterium]
MRRAWLQFAAVVALTVIPSPVIAQDWSQPWADPLDRPPRVDLSGSAGFLMPTRWSSLVLLGSISSATGVLEQVLARDLRVEPDREFDVAATYWRGRYGVRTQAGFSRSSLTIGATPANPPQLSTTDTTSIDIDTWLYDVRGAIGFTEYAPSRRIWPYGFFGFGGITYNLKGTVVPPLTFIERTPSRSGTTIIVAGDGRQFLLSVDQPGIETVFAVTFGVGTDFRIPLGPGGVALRLEASDRVAPSPLGLRIREFSPVGAFAPDAGVRFGIVHHLSATAGIVVQIGR